MSARSSPPAFAGRDQGLKALQGRSDGRLSNFVARYPHMPFEIAQLGSKAFQANRHRISHSLIKRLEALISCVPIRRV